MFSPEALDTTAVLAGEYLGKSVTVDGAKLRMFFIDGGWKAIFPRTDNVTKVSKPKCTYLELSGRTLGSSFSSQALFL